MPRPRSDNLRFTLRTLFLAIFVASCAFAYVASYYRLYRRGLADAAKYELTGFFYVPFDEVAQTHDLSRHYFRATAYAPLNWLDRQFFGAEGPVTCVTWSLSK